MPESKKPQKKHKILIVEDDKPMARALKIKLEGAGFASSIAFDGKIALDLLETDSFSLILLDLLMPNMDGFKFLETCKKKGINTPIIVLSNLSLSSVINKAQDLGAKEYFVKANVALADIMDYIKKMLS